MNDISEPDAGCAICRSSLYGCAKWSASCPKQRRRNAGSYATRHVTEDKSRSAQRDNDNAEIANSRSSANIKCAKAHNKVSRTAWLPYGNMTLWHLTEQEPLMLYRWHFARLITSARQTGHTLVFTLCLICIFLALASHFFIYCNLYWMLINVGSVQIINKQTNKQTYLPSLAGHRRRGLSPRTCDTVMYTLVVTFLPAFFIAHLRRSNRLIMI